MTDKPDRERADYYANAESWATDRERMARNALRNAWIVASVASVIALAEALAILGLTPLKTVVPYTLLVDRETGYVQALKPLERETITPDRALTRSLLAQYVIAREGFDIDSLKDDYRKVALWSAGEARTRYITDMSPTNPASPLAILPRRALVEVEIRSLSSLGPTTALVRFATIRTDPGGERQDVRPWAAVINYRFSGAAMSAADRLTNPLGFQVLRYRRDPELPLSEPTASSAPAPLARQPVIGAARLP